MAQELVLKQMGASPASASYQNKTHIQSFSVKQGKGTDREQRRNDGKGCVPSIKL